MSVFVLLKLAGAVVSVALAAGLLARDHGWKANRLIAAFLLCNAWWALCEYALYQETDPEHALWLYRLMAPGWMPLGLLCAHVSVTLAAERLRTAARLIRPAYLALAGLLPFAMTSGFVIANAEPTDLGWRPHFGPGMLLAYALLAVPLLAVLASWRATLAAVEDPGELRLMRIVFYGILAAHVAGTITAVALPLAGIDSIGLTTTLLAGVGVAAAATLRRHGHSLISPEAFARDVLDTLDDGVILVAEDGTVRDVNRGFLRMVAADDRRVIGRPVTRWLSELLAAHDAADAPSMMELRTETGGALPVVVSPPVACSGAGRVVGHAYLVRDRREILALRRQLLVAARLAAVGDLAKAISRSINEPVSRARAELAGLAIDWRTGEDIVELMAIQSACHEALEEGIELIDESIEGMERICSVVREVSGFVSDRDRAPFVTEALDRIVSRACRVARVQAPRELDLHLALEPGVGVRCHSDELERVVTNLLVNSIHALERRPVGEAHLGVAVMARGQRALLHIEDDGCGIEPEDLDRIFDPFFTTKPVGKGTGLGLAISYHIVKAHGGEIRIDSVPDRGTSVTVELPLEPIDPAAS